MASPQRNSEFAIHPPGAGTNLRHEPGKAAPPARAAGREVWDTGDLALGFVGDVGDLAKLVMAVDGRREIPGARERLGHELADCLWSVLVLADRYGVDLGAEFTRMTDGIERHLTRPSRRHGTGVRRW